ncbi:MAG: hypothetical protein O7D30_07645, partial [Rickettsia endosymbiont of Ixodes persulcatus]|nr:hypothetical protein [Rickettsia endosymbiont of Ixodes persulcatus]
IRRSLSFITVNMYIHRENRSMRVLVRQRAWQQIIGANKKLRAFEIVLPFCNPKHTQKNRALKIFQT